MRIRLSREELVYLVTKIINVDYETEEECSALISLFRDNVPEPEVLNLIYHHVPELTPEQIVEKALSYKPIITAPPPKPDQEEKK